MRDGKPAELRRAFLSGVGDLLPLVSGVLPFGLITGLAASEFGYSFFKTLAMTALFYAGSAQLVAFQLMRENAFPAVIVLTALVVNLRFTIYSASIAPHLEGVKTRWKLVISYFLSDQAYALSFMRFERADKENRLVNLYYFAGAAISMWVSWLVSVQAGLLVGTGIPDDFPLAFAIPLSFLALLVPALVSGIHLFAAIVAALVAVYAVSMPYNLGLICAVITGVSTGLALEQIVRSGKI